METFTLLYFVIANLKKAIFIIIIIVSGLSPQVRKS